MYENHQTGPRLKRVPTHPPSHALIICVVTTEWVVGLFFLIFNSRLIWHQTHG